MSSENTEQINSTETVEMVPLNVEEIVVKEEEKERINNLLDICQLSAFNYYTYVSDVKNLIKLRIEGHQAITPFGRLMRINGKMGYATLGEIEDKKMHIEFLDSLDKE